MMLSDKDKILVLFICLGLILITYLCIYSYSAKYCSGNLTEAMSNLRNFVSREKKSTAWEDVKLVMIKELTTGFYLTYFDTGLLRLEPVNFKNANQYFLYSKEGYIKIPKEGVCAYKVAQGSPMGVTICDASPSQQFVIQPDGRLIALTQMPYTAVDNTKLLEKQKMTCVDARPARNRAIQGGAVMLPTVVDCELAKSRWEIIEISPETYINYIDNAWKEPLAEPETPLRKYSGTHDLMMDWQRKKYSQPFSQGVYPHGSQGTGYPLKYNSKVVKDDISYW